MTDSLKPCPFCGKKPKRGDLESVSCPDISCIAGLTWHNADKWNTRPAPESAGVGEVDYKQIAYETSKRAGDTIRALELSERSLQAKLTEAEAMAKLYHADMMKVREQRDACYLRVHAAEARVRECVSLAVWDWMPQKYTDAEHESEIVRILACIEHQASPASCEGALANKFLASMQDFMEYDPKPDWRCAACEETGMRHCSDPANCGGMKPPQALATAPAASGDAVRVALEQAKARLTDLGVGGGDTVRLLDTAPADERGE